MGKTKLPPGTWIERELFQSKAFLSLKGFAPQLLILFLAKRKFIKHGRKGKEKHTCTNCDALNFTYLEAKETYGITQPRLTRAIDDLLSKGFIKIKHQGGCYKQDKTIYALSDSWRHWQPGTVINKRKMDVQRGFRKPNKCNIRNRNHTHIRNGNLNKHFSATKS